MTRMHDLFAEDRPAADPAVPANHPPDERDRPSGPVARAAGRGRWRRSSTGRSAPSRSIRPSTSGRCRDLAELTELPRELRDRLGERFRVGLPEVTSRHLSEDGTGKYLFRLRDGATIEAVDIPDRGRRTFCISSQAGCALACAFCVTGYWGAGRNLTAGEIVGQVQRHPRRPRPAAWRG